MRGRTLATAVLASSALIAALAVPRPVLAGKMTYLSLGDSIGFGETTFTQNPSNGDRGYVGLYADSLAAQNGGVRPDVVNLAIDGETTSSFGTGNTRVLPTVDFTNGSLQAQNSNYAGQSLLTQHFALMSAVQSAASAGNSIGTVSLSLGSNDLFALAQSPAFQSATPANQAAMLTQTLGAIQSNYTQILTDVRSMLPNANLLLLGSYNPFPAAPGSPFAALAGPAIAGLNQVIAGEAMAFGGHYVDTASAFKGNEAAYTHILDGPAGSYNVHPNGLGYAAIAIQMHSVPEPTTLALLGAMGIGLLVSRRYRKTHAVA